MKAGENDAASGPTSALSRAEGEAITRIADTAATPAFSVTREELRALAKRCGQAGFFVGTPESVNDAADRVLERWLVERGGNG